MSTANKMEKRRACQEGRMIIKKMSFVCDSTDDAAQPDSKVIPSTRDYTKDNPLRPLKEFEKEEKRKREYHEAQRRNLKWPIVNPLTPIRNI